MIGCIGEPMHQYLINHLAHIQPFAGKGLDALVDEYKPDLLN